MADSKIFSKALNAYKNAGGDLVIPVVGVPFGGPSELGGKDLHGEYFTAKTDIGPLTEVLSYFDHGLGKVFGTDLIGKAYRKTLDPLNGWVYDVVVDRRHRYFEALSKLAEENLLSASSSAYPHTTSREADGEITKWHVIEISLTPEPANSRAVQLMKSVLIKELGMTDEKIVQDTPESAGEGDLAQSIVKAVEDAMADANANVDMPMEAQAPVAVVFDIAAAFAQLNSRLDALETGVKSVAVLQVSVNDIKTALPVLASQIAASVSYKVGSKVQEEARKSVPEKVAEAVIDAAPRTPSLTATFGRKGA